MPVEPREGPLQAIHGLPDPVGLHIFEDASGEGVADDNQDPPTQGQEHGLCAHPCCDE